MRFDHLKQKLTTLRLKSLHYLAQKPRILKHRLLSTCGRVHGKPIRIQAVQIDGLGQVYFDGCVRLGYYPSPFFFNGYIYIEARGNNTTVRIGDGTWINNNFVLICEHKSISIGRDVLIGTNVEIYDSDFHGLDPTLRKFSDPDRAKEVVIGDNVFIGSNVRIMKGSKVGNNSVLANGAVVVDSIPANVIAGGNPAKVIRSL
jgi:maltose O-acetyltransferase